MFFMQKIIYITDIKLYFFVYKTKVFIFLNKLFYFIVKIRIIYLLFFCIFTYLQQGVVFCGGLMDLVVGEASIPIKKYIGSVSASESASVVSRSISCYTNP